MKKKIVMLFLLIGVIFLQVSNVRAQVNNKKEMANVVVLLQFSQDNRKEIR